MKEEYRKEFQKGKGNHKLTVRGEYKNPKQENKSERSYD